uniref:Uncharacterized protein n=1 Tax=Avena sativa TaxID=4498 RepID=A0ACD5XSS0_AVESA
MTKTTQLAAGCKRFTPAINGVIVAFVLVVPTLVILFGGRIGEQPAVWIKTAVAGIRRGPDDASFLHRKTTLEERLLGGLLVEGFDQESCHSRYQSAVYRRNPGRKPSQYLVSKLRSQEALQRRCGPGTAAYTNALEQLKSGKSVASPECRYLVSISYRGLGNRIISAASGFLYAVLTDRVFLVDPSTSMDELFCEPFPDTSWLVPPGFPIWYQGFYLSTPERYGKMREDGVLRTDAINGSAAAGELPAFAYVHLDHNQTEHDKLFFCDDDQRLLSNIQWLLIRSDGYIAPGLFLVEAFQEELHRLFPERDAVFHHLGRYLFHPTNRVWGLITRYYDAHFAWAQRVVGIQVRVPWSESPEVLKQIKTCTQNERLLPAVLGEEDEEPLVETTAPRPRGGARPTAVLITSLQAWFYDNMKGMYWERATANGEVVVFDQPSHEEVQRYGVKSHEYKAWAEMYLLSMADALVTSGESTFGYVAQGLSGMRAWVLDMGKANSTVGWPCSRDMSMEPCYHVPPTYGCKRREDAGKIEPHVRHCKDWPTGLKLVDQKDW